jgi:hypothetical protein
MKKTIITILLTAAFPVMAQSAVSAPSAPVIPNMVTVSPNATAALAVATTNRIFIDQSGDNPNVNMTQDGTGNAAGSGGRPVYLRGIDQTVVTRQIGVNNDISLEAVNNTTGTGQGVNITIQQIGNSNVVDAACGGGTASDGTTALTGCKDAVLNWKFAGNTNVMQFRGTGDNLNSNVDASGNSNEFYIDAIGTGHSQTLKVSGNFNVFNVSQTSTGASGSSAWIDVNGSTNKFTVNQTGTVDSVLNIKSVASTGVWNINQKTN